MGMIGKIVNLARLDKDVLRRRAYFYYMLDGRSEFTGYSFNKHDYDEKVAAIEDMFAKYIGVKNAILTGSGGNSLELVLKCLSVKARKDVVFQAYTCNILKRMISKFAVPVPCDTDLLSYNADMDDLKKRLSKNSIFLSIHTYGNPMQMDDVLRLAEEKGAIVIEDCAHALGAEYRNRKVGSFGDAAIFSLRKNLAIGEGGFVATNDDLLAEKIRKERDTTARHRFMARDLFGAGALISRRVFHDRPNRMFAFYNMYTGGRKESNDVLFSMLGVDIATQQFKRLDDFIKKTQKNADYLSALLRHNDNIILPMAAKNSRHVFTRFAVRFKSFSGSVDDVCKMLFENGFEPGMSYHNHFLMNVGEEAKRYPKSLVVSSTMVPVGLPPTLVKDDIKLIAEIFDIFSGKRQNP